MKNINHHTSESGTATIQEHNTPARSSLGFTETPAPPHWQILTPTDGYVRHGIGLRGSGVSSREPALGGLVAGQQQVLLHLLGLLPLQGSFRTLETLQGGCTS